MWQLHCSFVRLLNSRLHKSDGNDIANLFSQDLAKHCVCFCLIGLSLAITCVDIHHINNSISSIMLCSFNKPNFYAELQDSDEINKRPRSDCDSSPYNAMSETETSEPMSLVIDQGVVAEGSN